MLSAINHYEPLLTTTLKHHYPLTITVEIESWSPRPESPEDLVSSTTFDETFLGGVVNGDVVPDIQTYPKMDMESRKAKDNL